LFPGLEFLELNLAHGGDVDWDKLAQLPALHSLMLVPPISPHSSGHGPEHAQQVCRDQLSRPMYDCYITVKLWTSRE